MVFPCISLSCATETRTMTTRTHILHQIDSCRGAIRLTYFSFLYLQLPLLYSGKRCLQRTANNVKGERNMNVRPDLHTNDAEDQPFMRRTVAASHGGLSIGSALSVQHTVGRGVDQARLRWHCTHFTTHFWRERSSAIVSILVERPALSKEQQNSQNHKG